MTALRLRGFDIHKEFLGRAAQQEVLDAVRGVVRQAPFFRPEVPRGGRMSVRMSAAGRYGWFSDRRGYRYVTEHPDGQPWPEIPAQILAIWDKLTGLERRPECCIVWSKTRIGQTQVPPGPSRFY